MNQLAVNIGDRTPPHEVQGTQHLGESNKDADSTYTQFTLNRTFALLFSITRGGML